MFFRSGRWATLTQERGSQNSRLEALEDEERGGNEGGYK